MGCSSKPVCANQTLALNANKTAIPPPTLSAASSSGGLSGGAIAGIVIGSIVGVALLVYILYTLLVKFGWSSYFSVKRKSSESSTPVLAPEEKKGDLGAGIPFGGITYPVGTDGNPLSKDELEKEKEKLRGIEEKELSKDEKTRIALNMYNFYKDPTKTLDYTELSPYRPRDIDNPEIADLFHYYLKTYAMFPTPLGNGTGTERSFTEDEIVQILKYSKNLPQDEIDKFDGNLWSLLSKLRFKGQ